VTGGVTDFRLAPKARRATREPESAAPNNMAIVPEITPARRRSRNRVG